MSLSQERIEKLLYGQKVYALDDSLSGKIIVWSKHVVSINLQIHVTHFLNYYSVLHRLYEII